MSIVTFILINENGIIEHVKIPFVIPGSGFSSQGGVDGTYKECQPDGCPALSGKRAHADLHPAQNRGSGHRHLRRSPHDRFLSYEPCLGIKHWNLHQHHL